MAPYHPVQRRGAPRRNLVERDERGRRRWTKQGTIERSYRILDTLRQQNVILNERPALSPREKQYRIRLIRGIFSVEHQPIDAFFALHDFVVFERQHLIAFSQQVERAHERIEHAARRFTASQTTTEVDGTIRKALTRAIEEHLRVQRDNEKKLKIFDRVLTDMTPTNKLLHHARRNPRQDEKMISQALRAFDEGYENELVQKRLMGRKHTMKGEMHRINRLRGTI